MPAAISRKEVSNPANRSPDTTILTQHAENARGRPPTPPPKDSPSTPRTPNPSQDLNATSFDMSSYFRPGHLSRAGSVYSLSRVSFTSQISQLTAVHLPDAASLKESISSIATAPSAAKTLIEAANQIQKWIQKASDVMGGLDAGDDVDWAAAAGKDGLGEINQAVGRFEELVQVYISSVEELQLRDDASQIPSADMKNLVDQVERVTAEWRRIRKAFDDVKYQVELAIEWEELENVHLADISNDLDELSRAVFEMEERRHQLSADNSASPDTPIDIEELETIVHEAPQNPTSIPSLEKQLGANLSLHSTSAQQSLKASAEPDDSSLIGLFARMQPLRAALDFLPMRLSTFRGKALEIFPSACEQLNQRRDALEQQYQRLNDDADSLRKELGEDRWNLVFRNAAKQAIKLIDSVERSITKVDESLGNNTALRHASNTLKKIENYHAKKQHYCPAIERVLAIVDRGVKDRLTVNGEIVRLRSDLRQRWQSLQRDMNHIDSVLEEYAADTSGGIGQQQQQLRDSLSSIMSNDRSLTNSVLATPGSSPPSSVVSRKGSSHDLSGQSPSSTTKARSEQSTTQNSTPTPSAQYLSPKSSPPKQAHPPTRSTPVQSNTPSAGQRTSRVSSTSSKPAVRAPPRPPSQPDRPRWNYSKSSSSDYSVSDYYKSLMAKTSSRRTSTNAATPTSSPLSNRQLTPQSSGSRPTLSRKASNLSNASAQPQPRSSSTTRSAISYINHPQDSPLHVQKRGASHNSTLSSHSNPRASPIPHGPTASTSHFTSPSSSPRTSFIPTSTPRSRRSSNIPVAVDRTKLVPSSPALHASTDIATEDLPSGPLDHQ